ncbi:MAG: helix-hairpin-helix domain-containing protein [Balneolales bacterium]
MWKRKWFFWLETLQITPGERRVLITLISISLIVSGVNLCWPSATVYNSDYYKPIIYEFERLSNIRQKEREVVLARYDPPAETDRGLFAVLFEQHRFSGSSRIMYRLSGSGLNNKAGYRRVDLHREPAAGKSPRQEKVQVPGTSGQYHGKSGDHSNGPEPVDLHKAGKEELITLPGIGPVIAERIIAYRKENGCFKKPEDLLNVSGIGPVTLEHLRPYILIE